MNEIKCIIASSHHDKIRNRLRPSLSLNRMFRRVWTDCPIRLLIDLR